MRVCPVFYTNRIVYATELDHKKYKVVVRSHGCAHARMSALTLKLAGDATVRGTTTSHGEQVFSVYEFINVVCRKTGLYSIQVWVRLLRNHKKPPFCYFKVSFEDNTSHPMHMIPAMTIAGLQRLLLILGNKVSGELRQTVEETFKCHMNGDASMITAVGAPDAGEEAPDAGGTKCKLECKQLLFSMELEERKLELEERKMALLERKMALQERSWALLEKS